MWTDSEFLFLNPNNLSVQIIDDKQKTLVSASSIEKEIKSKKVKKIEKSSLIGEILEKGAKEKYKWCLFW